MILTSQVELFSYFFNISMSFSALVGFIVVLEVEVPVEGLVVVNLPAVLSGAAEFMLVTC